MRWYQKLAVLGMTGLALALSCDNSGLEEKVQNPEPQKQELREETVSEANQWLRGFPTEIPGARKIEKNETPNASYTLAHIKQTHHGDVTPVIENNIPASDQNLVDNLDQILQEKVDNEAFESQEDIYKILSYLNENSRAEEIYLEGITKENKEQTVEMFNRLHGALEEYKERLGRTIWYYENEREELRRELGKSKEEMEHYKEDLRESAKKYKEMERKAIIFSAASKLVYEEGLEVLIAEDKELNEKAYRLTRDNIEGNDREVQEEREDYLLNLVASQDQPYAVTVYGANHDWEDNIERWNQNYNKEFSLIEVYPKSYEGNEK